MVKIQALYDVQWRYIRQAAFSWIDTLDKIKHKVPANVVVATAVTFLLVCERFKLDPRHVLDTADRILRRSLDADPQYPRAIRQYLQEELPNV